MRYTGSNRSMALGGSEFPKDGQQLKGIVSSGRERVGGDGHSLFPGAFNVSDGGEADPLSEFVRWAKPGLNAADSRGFVKAVHSSVSKWRVEEHAPHCWILSMGLGRVDGSVSYLHHDHGAR
ncbi:predicted protein [Histoplasma capsulatum var. duboisii H88]|uniref:Predicted protein n=1 Tax=Ajellomyces capsulatus (strain H88) TaxID=544711 RepID=F0UP66_AJEC8|nr:predicted protein [Histoplasma capsulatum var. duboisii H88]